MERQRVLFLCTHNSARSQMAEAWLHRLGGERYEVHSAGTVATGVHPLAVQAMAEVGLDISKQQSKTLQRYLNEPWDTIITVCDDAKAACPLFPGGKVRLHWSLPDPSQAVGSESERLAAFRGVRDVLGDRVEELVQGVQVGLLSGS